MSNIRFEWDLAKDKVNREKHGISFEFARRAFMDHGRLIVEDMDHSGEEDRYYCIGMIDGGIVTVRFTYRGNRIRIFGAGYWRKGKQIYETENKIYR